MLFEIQSLPVTEMLFSLLWFVLQAIAFAIGAAVYWNRPFDRASQLFLRVVPCDAGSLLGEQSLVDCLGSFWLTAPSLICTMLLPAVCLHFFLVFPAHVAAARLAAAHFVGTDLRPSRRGHRWCCLRWRRFAAGCRGGAWWNRTLPTIRQLLTAIRIGIYVSLVVGGVYFVIALACVRRSYRGRATPSSRSSSSFVAGGTVDDPVHDHGRFIWRFSSAEKFALGWARVPDLSGRAVFHRRLCVRNHPLSPVARRPDRKQGRDVLSRQQRLDGRLCAARLRLGPMARQYLNIFPLTQQSALISIVLMLAVILLLWFRDAIQRTIDRRFFREKYQLGKALERMNRAVGHLADPEAVAELMLGSCRDVLGVDRAALYLRTSAGISVPAGGGLWCRESAPVNSRTGTR